MGLKKRGLMCPGESTDTHFTKDIAVGDAADVAIGMVL